MADAVLPEVQAKVAAEAAAQEEARLKKAQERAVRLRARRICQLYSLVEPKKRFFVNVYSTASSRILVADKRCFTPTIFI